MKKFCNCLTALLLLFAAGGAFAQFSPNTVLTASTLNAALAAPTITAGSINGTTNITTSGTVTLTGVNNLGAQTSATTQNYLASSNLVATSSFVRSAILASSATIPINIIGGGGTYNFASIGTGAIFGVTSAGGALTSVSSIVAGGTGYQVGDCLVMVGGNGDAVVYVSAVSSGVITTATILYGGTGYTGTPQLAGMALPPGSRSGAVTGTLTSNATVIVPAGTLLAGARRFGFQNNTTGAFTVTVKLSNGAGGSTGTGVVLPQGTANSTSITLYTNGVTDVWPEVNAGVNFVVSNSLTVAGVPVLGSLSGVTGSIGGGALGNAACATGTVTINGATTSMAAAVTPNTFPGASIYYRAYVSAPNTVTVSVCSAAFGGSTPTASTYNVRVIQ